MSYVGQSVGAAVYKFVLPRGPAIVAPAESCKVMRANLEDMIGGTGDFKSTSGTVKSAVGEVEAGVERAEDEAVLW